jgi:signal peptidase II
MNFGFVRNDSGAINIRRCEANRKEQKMKYAILTVSIAAGDFLLKKHMEERLAWGERKPICKGKIVLRKYHNHGIAFNFLEKHSGLVKVLCASLMLSLAICWCILLQKKHASGLLWGLSFLLGGGASNLYDRAVRGYVVDYFSFQTPLKWLNRIIFNVSDLCIFLGGIIVFIKRNTR